ncbi:MAG: hypothetical protein AABW46_02685 [Nanoarchaeota archaeon]
MSEADYKFIDYIIKQFEAGVPRGPGSSLHDEFYHYKSSAEYLERKPNLSEEESALLTHIQGMALRLMK